MSHKLPELNYAYDALEPQIDAKTMEIHHTKHHQTYVTNLNAALEKHPELENQDLVSIIANITILPEDIQVAVRNNGGGHLNHSLFWEILTPGSEETSNEVITAIEETFGSMEAFKTKFDAAAKGRFGSGWAWLVVTADKKLDVISTPNQDNPIMEGLTPVLGLDVWEHAYYLNYQNRRPDYIQAFFEVVNWSKVNELYLASLV